MLSERKVFVIVPAYNEGPRIGRVLSTMPNFVDHVVVVDDSSTDHTVAICEKASDPRVTVVRHDENRGVGAAIVTGYRFSQKEGGHAHDAFAVMAGDAQMDPADLRRVVEPIVTGRVGYVKGNRWRHPEVHAAMPRVRYAGGRILSLLTTAATGRRIEDSQCGYTAIRRDACARIDLDRVWMGYGYPNDLFARLVEAGIDTEEVVVRPVYADEESKLRPWHLVGITRVIAKAGARRIRSRAITALERVERP